MADTKRPGGGGGGGGGGKVPVATPHIGPSGIISLETALSAAIGSRIRIQTIAPASQTHEGTLFTVSPALSLVTLATSPASQASPSYHIFPIASLQAFTVLSLPSPKPQTPLPPLDSSALQARLASAVSRLKDQEARRGKGVSKEAQEIFDRLSKTLPTRWDGTRIVVNDVVVIEAPYRSEDCRAGTGAPKDSLGRVRKVLESERSTLAQKATNRPAVPAAVPMSGPRKGG